jgi:predicted RecA/RadA family phage recombinase
MTAVYVQDDEMIDYTPGADVAAGDVVVQGDLIGIATRDIKANVLGALCVDGIFDVPKASGAGTAIGAGVKVYWDPTPKQATATAGALKLLGKTTQASADADTTVRVRLQQ